MEANLFFGLVIDPTSLLGKSIVLLLAVVLGGLIGLERQLKGNPAGLRTHILVSVGATLITLTSVELGRERATGNGADPGRIIAQIVSGIGFLGAGAILRDGLTVRGLTTAASIWVTAGIGIAIGINPHLGEVGVVATLVVLFTLIVLRALEPHLPVQAVFRTVQLELAPGKALAPDLLKRLEQEGCSLTGITRETSGLGQRLRLQVRVRPSSRIHDLASFLTEQEEVIGFTIE